MDLRDYHSGDCPALIRLFRETVHAVCAGDYTPEQLDAWAPEDVPQPAWNRSFLAHRTLVAVEGEEIVGFADLDPATGYLDRLYVHRDHQRQGVAAALCDALEPLAPGRVFTHASRTARPFFERRGYRVVRARQVERRGITLDNYTMEKLL